MEPKRSEVDQEKLHIIENYSEMVYRLAYSMTKDKHDADDIHQEVFVSFLRRCPVFENEEHVRAWLVRVTVNCCKNYYKTAWRRRTVSLAACEGAEGIGGASGGTEPSESEELIKTVKRLPERYRAVIHLFYYEDMSVKEIAAALGRRESTVRTQLVRARRLLREWLCEEVD